MSIALCMRVQCKSQEHWLEVHSDTAKAASALLEPLLMATCPVRHLWLSVAHAC